MRTFLNRFFMVGFLAALFGFASPAQAHHAKDYLVTGSYETLHQGKHLLFLNENYTFENGDDSDSYHGELTPGWICGITDHWQGEIHSCLRLLNGTGGF